MVINLINPETLELEDVLTLYESVQWVTCYNAPDGKFQIDCGIQYFYKFKEDMYVENSDDPEHIGVIKKIQTLRSNEKESVRITGIMLEKDILSHRVAKGIYTYIDVMPTIVIYNLLYQAMFDTVELSRQMSNLGNIFIPASIEIPDITTIDYSSKYPNLSDEIYTLIQNANLGFKAKLNKDTKKIDLYFYVGIDHTEGSDEPIILSRDYGTALEVDYSKDSSQNITNLIAIGEDNVYVEVQKGGPSGIQRIEKAIDVSGEAPWPTYMVEKSGEGGNYYRYKKVVPEGFVTNQDIWEKYSVERIDTTRVVYDSVTYRVDRTMPVSEALQTYPSLAASATLNRDVGLLLGSDISTAGAVTSAIASLSENPSGEILLGFSVHTSDGVSESSQATPLSSNDNSENVKSTDSINQNPAVKSKVNSGGSTLDNSAEVEKLTLKLSEENMTVYVGKSEMAFVTVPVTYYEDRDFIEYVYVDPGKSPSNATSIIEGSIDSGNILYYENFEEIKMEISKYKDTLTKIANLYLNNFSISESIDVKLYELSNQRFRHEYNLGDILTAKDKEIGFAKDLRVTSAIEIWDSKGYSVSVTLGTNVPSLTNRIKFLSKGGN